MLYSLIVTVLVLSFLLPVAAFFSFRYGYSIGRGKRGITAPFKKAKPKIPEDVMRFNDIIENINSYNGSEQGQKEVR